MAGNDGEKDSAGEAPRKELSLAAKCALAEVEERRRAA